MVVYPIEINPLPINTAKEDGIPVQPTSVREACQETDTIIELYYGLYGVAMVIGLLQIKYA